MTGPVHVTVWGGGRIPAPRAVLVHGTMTWGTDGYGFAAQRPLAEMAEIRVVDRRGFGASPDVGRSVRCWPPRCALATSARWR